MDEENTNPNFAAKILGLAPINIGLLLNRFNSPLLNVEKKLKRGSKNPLIKKSNAKNIIIYLLKNTRYNTTVVAVNIALVLATFSFICLNDIGHVWFKKTPLVTVDSLICRYKSYLIIKCFLI